MKTFLAVAALSLFPTASLCAQSRKPVHPQDHREAEYYVSMYAQHHRVPVSLVRAMIERESNWRACAVSAKGAKGLMQFMPETARRLGVRDSCNINQNISGPSRIVVTVSADTPIYVVLEQTPKVDAAMQRRVRRIPAAHSR